MAYIGVSPSNGVRRKHTYTATAAQTSFSGAGAEGITLGYLDSNYVDVYQNGVKLSEADYTSTSGTAIVLATGATASDMIEVVVYDVFSVADTVSKSAGGTFDGNITAAGTLAVTGVVTANAGVVVDEMTLDGDTLTATDTFTIDAVEDITLDAASTLVRIKHNGTQRFIFNTDATPEIDALGGNFTLHANTSDADIIFNGNDGGAAITALTLDMSAAGAATFNSTVAATGINFAGDRAINNTNDTAYNIRTSSGSGSHYFGSGRTGFSGGIEIAKLGTTGTVFNDGGVDIDFRVESNGNANALLVDAGAENILFGQASADSTANGAYFHLGANNAHLAVANTQASDVTSLVFLNRQGADGTLMAFLKGNSTKGSISVSGATVSFNGFSGRHESSGILANTPVGTVVSTIDALDVYPNTSTNAEGNVVTHPEAGQTRGDHAKVEISTSQGDPCVYGVVSEFDGNGKLIVASVGIGSIRVTGACAKGDLLESNGDGTAKVQSDDIIRSKTIGKVTIGNSSTDVKLVSCVLYCG